MFRDEFNAAANAAAAKLKLFINNLPGYFILSMLAGAYIGFGILLVFTLSGAMGGAPYTKLVMGCCFSVALSLVVIAGAELFTGNNLVMTAGFIPLLTRGMLCNTLVCLAVRCGFRAGSEAGKLIMVFWCILAFFATGFEHSVANMTLLTLALINNGGNDAITIGGFWFNLMTVTLGNMAGAILFVALPYHIGSMER